MTELEAYALWYIYKINSKEIVDKYRNLSLKEFAKTHGILELNIITNFVKEQERLLKKYEASIISYHSPYYPQLLKEASYFPPVLFCVGNCEILTKRILTIVGTRRATKYGTTQAKKFAKALSKHFVIASGMAFGIDAYAHIGTLEGNGKTIAVLASGVDIPTPKSNAKIYENILKNDGAVISIYPISHTPKRYSFVERNYILAAISVGTFVVEAPLKSGALITARYAADLGRDVFALPGDVTRKTSEGTNHLIKSGAFLAATPEDILEFYGLENKNINDVRDPILEEIRKYPKDASEIAESLQIPLPQVLARLTELEVTGLVTKDGGKYIAL